LHGHGLQHLNRELEAEAVVEPLYPHCGLPTVLSVPGAAGSEVVERAAANVSRSDSSRKTSVVTPPP
jgi:hypothetical protein